MTTTTTSQLPRADLALIIGADINGWMAGFYIATQEVSHAVVAKKATRDLVTSLPPLTTADDLTEADAERVAQAAGLPYGDEAGPVRGRLPFGAPFSADAEDVACAVQALQALVSRDVSDGSENTVWQFPYLDEYTIKTTAEEISETLAREVHDVADAARLVVDAIEEYSERRGALYH